MLAVAHVRPAAPSVSAPLRYAVALMAVAVTGLIQFTLDPRLELAGPFSFVPAIVVAGWYGGLGPALLATTTGVAAVCFVWLSSTVSLPAGSLERVVALLVFAAAALVISVLTESGHRTRVRLEEASERAAAANQRLEASVRDLRTAFDVVPIGLAWAGDSGARIETNQEFDRLLRLSMGRLVPFPARSDARPPVRIYRRGAELRTEDLPLSVALSENRVVRDFGIDVVQSDGTTRSLLLSAAPLQGDTGTPHGAVCGGIDVTTYRGRMQALWQNGLRLQRALELEHTARAEAEAISRSKDEFLAMLGHELRNPLGAITTAMHILNHVHDDATAAGRAREVITRQTAHLARLIDDLLDVNRVLTGKIALSREPVDLGEVAERVVATVAATGRTAHYHLHTVTEPVWVDADATRVEQIVTNLVSNALKYTQPGGTVEVMTRAEGGRGMLEVRDTGIGIPGDLLPRVFDLFVQGQQSIDRAQGGLGIGLTLVKRLVELHGGTVRAESLGVGRGSTFTVELPEAASPDGRKAAAGPPEFRCRVLIVEDSPDSREMLRTMLTLAGCDVQTAAEGLAAVEAARRLCPDAVIVDLGLPGIDGYEVARRIRSAGRPVQLIALTGYGSPEDRRRTAEAGFDAHLVKPADLTQLMDALARPAAVSKQSSSATTGASGNGSLRERSHP